MRTVFSFFFFLFCGLNLIPLELWGRVHDFETTRLKSTGGTGVGSVLQDEALVLNPAPIAFFNTLSLYAQKTFQTLSQEGPSQSPLTPTDKIKSGHFAFIAGDSRSMIKGGASYVKQTEWKDRRERMSAALGLPVSTQSSIGVLLHKTNDLFYHNQLLQRDHSYQLNLGALHAISKELTLGLVLQDVLRSHPEDNRFILGGQYLVSTVFSVLFDVGSQYYEDLAKNILYRGAVQINFISGLYLKAGLFYDRGRMERGSGVGLSWVAPKLMIDVALKNTSLFESEEMAKLHSYRPNRSREVSMALSFHF